MKPMNGEHREEGDEVIDSESAVVCLGLKC